MKHRDSYNSGFTLIELLVVISIISLLSSAVLSRVMLARDRSRIAAGQDFAAQAGRVSGDELQGSWDLSEGSGSIAKDASGNGSGGSILGTISWTTDSPDKLGGSLFLNGTDGRINVPYSPKYQPATALSVGAWIKVAKTDDGQKIVSTTESGGYSLSFAGGNCPTQTYCARINVGGTYYTASVSASTIKIGKWHHTFMTYDGETLSLYLDGAKVATNESPSGAITYGYQNPFCIGGESSTIDCNAGEYLNGNIDYVRFYSKSLSASAIQKQYASEYRRFYLASK